MSFDVKSLFTSISLQLALDYTGTLLPQTADDTPLPPPNDKIMNLLRLCLESTFFQYNGRHYKQLHGTAMGSPVSVVVAEIVMQHIEKRALATYDQTLHFWFRYVDDTITILQTDDIDVFHGHLNRRNSDIQFTRELEFEDNGKIPFLDCLVSRDDTRLRTTLYRKPTHTDRLLDQSSYNPTSHRATTLRTLTRRAQIICDSADSLRDENEPIYARYFTRTITVTSLLTPTITNKTNRMTNARTQRRKTNSQLFHCHTLGVLLRLLHGY